MDLVEYFLDFSSIHPILFRVSFSFTPCSKRISSTHCPASSCDKDLRRFIIHSPPFPAVTHRALFICTVLIKLGEEQLEWDLVYPYILLKQSVLPIIHFLPHPHLILCFTLHRPCQIWEPPFPLQVVRFLFRRYLFLRSSQHMSSWSALFSLHTHLRTSASFKTLVFIIPTPQSP
jgi:hypothetical protein